MPKPDYDTTLARIAGNIASGIAKDFFPTEPGDPQGPQVHQDIARCAVGIARAIVDDIKRTEPLPDPAPPAGVKE